MAVLIRSPSGLHAASKLIREACACGAQLQASVAHNLLEWPYSRGSEVAALGKSVLLTGGGVPTSAQH